MSRYACLTLLALSLSLTSAPAQDFATAQQGVGSDPLPVTVLSNGISLWSADDGEHGRELWRTDGSPPGTYLLADALEGPLALRFRLLAHAEDRAFLSRDYGYGAREIWVTGGTPTDTFQISGPLILESGAPALWVPSQRILYFRAGDEETGQELWRSDGTPGGTYRVADLRPGPPGSEPSDFVEFRGRVFFRAFDGVDGMALWSTDGTAAGTRIVRAGRAGAGPLQPSRLTVLGNRLLFFGFTRATGIELWTTDGTRAGTRLVRDSVPGPGGLAGWNLAEAGGKLWFIASSQEEGEELWVTDGTAGGTRRLTDLAPKHAFTSQSLAGLGLWMGNRFLFAADEGEGARGYEIWSTDGTRAGTQVLRDICPGPCHGLRGILMGIYKGRLYFQGSDGRLGVELWSTDGTPAGTRLWRDICPGECSSSPFGFQQRGGILYFGADDGIHGHEIWRTNGRQTLRVSDLEEPLQFFAIPTPNGFAFPHREKATGLELWHSDGTRAGTRLLRDIHSEPNP